MKQLLAAALFFIVGHLSAQLIQEDTTLNEPFFKANKFHSSGYVQAEVHGGQIFKTKGVGLVGFGLNWTINHKFVVSAQFFTTASRNSVRPYVEPGAANANLVHHFAGAGFGYIFFSDKKFSLQPALSGGWCVAKYENATDKFRRKDFGAILPSLSGVFNASKHFRIGAGINYRLVVGSSNFPIKGADLSGVGGVVFFRAGTF